MDLPGKVRITGADWTIEASPEELDAHGKDGMTWHRKQLIKVNAIAPRSKQKASLLHELVHALEEGLSPANELSEQQITTIGAGFAQVFADNPAILAFLASGT